MNARHLILLGALAASIALAQEPDAEPLTSQLQRGIYAEETEGDLDAAIAIYRRIADQHRANQAIAAEALFRLADCLSRTGDRDQGAAALRRLIAEHPQAKELATRSRARLAALGAPAGPLVARRLWAAPAPLIQDGARVSPDGAWISVVDWYEGGNLVALDLSRGRVRHLTTGGTFEGEIVQFAESHAFSPDSRRIAHAWYRSSPSPSPEGNIGSFGLRLATISDARSSVLVPNRRRPRPNDPPNMTRRSDTSDPSAGRRVRRLIRGAIFDRRRPSHSPLLLPLAGLASVGCVLWFTTIAMRNEGVAVRQRLSHVYSNHLVAAREALSDHWKTRSADLDRLARLPSAPARFAQAVATHRADGAIIYALSGKPLYPNRFQRAEADDAPPPREWIAARRAEFENRDWSQAVQSYRALERSTDDPQWRARAVLAQARCLGKTDQQAAVQTLKRLITDPSLRHVQQVNGAALVPNATLMLLKRLGPNDEDEAKEVSKELARRLNDYENESLLADQRLFLMRELSALCPSLAPFPTLSAEILSARVLEAELAVPNEPILTRLGDGEIWGLRSSEGDALALFRQRTIHAESASALARIQLPDARLRLAPPGVTPGPGGPIAPILAAPALPGWTLALQFDGPDPFETVSQHQRKLYLWSGLIAATLIAFVSIAAAWHIAAQTRIAALKSHLVANVSHELRTPLASMRAVVDTLRSGRIVDDRQREEYLAMLAKENHRLTQLIDSFLAFSRSESDQRRLQFETIHPNAVLNEAVEALRDRLNAVGCRFEREFEENPPPIIADPNALRAAVINLLDNALKYTGEEKHIRLRSFQEGDRHCFEVADNGIGLSRAESEEIFDRFYQADRSPTRRAGGCGLGLAVVRLIVDEHQGQVEVESRPGEGSRFTITLPARHNTNVEPDDSDR